MAFQTAHSFRTTCVLVALTGWMFGETYSRSGGYPVPIGLLYDSRSRELPQAVDEQIAEYNNMETHRFDFQPRVMIVDSTDSFNVSRALCELLSSGAIVLMGSLGRATLDTVKAYSESLEIPFIFFNNPSDPSAIGADRNPSLQYFMQPTISSVIVDVMESYQWPSLLYIYSTDEALFRLEQIYDYIHDYPNAPEVVARKVATRQDCFDLINSTHSNKQLDIRIVLDMEPEDVQWVIDEVLAGGKMYKIRFHFVLPFLSMRYISLKAFKTGGVNITGFELFSDNNLGSYIRPAGKGKRWKPYRALAEDAMLVLTESLLDLQRMRVGALFSGVTGWDETYAVDTITCQPPSRSRRWRYGRDLARVITNSTFKGKSGKVKFSSTGHREKHSFEVIEVGMYRGVAEVGTWTEDNFEPKVVEQIYDKINRTIDNRTRTVISIDDKPYIFVATELQDGLPIVGRLRFHGYCADLAEMVSRSVGYEYHIRLVKDKRYGSPRVDGTWDGMIGELITHEADIAFAPLTITSDREKVLDFTKPFMSLGISIMIKRPADNDPHVFSFMEPLSQEIWLCTVFAFIGVSVVLFLVSRFSSEEWNVDGGDGKLSNDFTIGNSLWFSLGAFMQQGCDVLPKSVSGRIVTSVWWFFTLIIISSYTANLAAYLTTMRMSAPIKSAEDLAKQTEIKYGTLQRGSTNDFFKQTRVSLYQRMWSFMTSQKTVFVDSNKEGIEKVRQSNGKYAFLIESTTNEYANRRQPCDTIKVGTNLDSKGYGVATPMGSDIRDRLTLAILELREHGDLEELKKEWWDRRSECPEETVPKESKDNALTLTKVAGIFYILVAGLALSVISVVLEFLYKTKVDSRKQNVSFGSEARSKFRLSISGHSDDESMGQRTPLRATGTFTYTAVDGRPRTSTQTVV